MLLILLYHLLEYSSNRPIGIKMLSDQPLLVVRTTDALRYAANRSIG